MEQLLILLKEGLASGVVAILRISLILVPIMIVAEIARDFNILDPISKKIKWILDLLTLPPEAAFPLLVGVCFGLVYGSALIVDFAREGSLKKRDLLLTGIFPLYRPCRDRGHSHLHCFRGKPVPDPLYPFQPSLPGYQASCFRTRLLFCRWKRKDAPGNRRNNLTQV